MLTHINGHELRDSIDWIWWGSDDSAELLAIRSDRTRLSVSMRRSVGVCPESWGIAFENPIFDGVRECTNACSFCFVSQLPDGLRSSLYVRDDDFRLSFLAGNFVTLTNVADQDVERILEQRLSPLYVSVHAVDAEVRRRLLCPTDDDDALQVLERLLRGGIEVHIQVVLVPGVNDGPVLDETLGWLAQRTGIASVGAVPVGRTSRAHSAAAYHKSSATEVLSVLHEWQRRMVESRGARWAYGADELYLLADVQLPSWGDYDGFPQFENGIGLARAFVDELAESWPAHSARERGRSGKGTTEHVVVTGALFAPVLSSALLSLPSERATLRVLAVENSLFGGNVSVAGLLGGQDVIDAIRDDAATASTPATYLVPDIILNDQGLTLDDIPVSELAERAGANIRLVSWDAAGLLSGIASPPEGEP